MITKKQVFSKPFNLVYENNYPELLVGPGFFTESNLASVSDPKEWIKKNPADIEKERAKQVFSFKSFRKTDATKFDKSLFEVQLLAQTENTSELEININQKPKLIKENYSGINNFSYEFEEIKIIDNPKIPTIIDKTVNDGDLKAKEGIINIYNKLEDIYKVEQVLSLGLLGITRNRVLVPTRWAITSTDDILSKDLIENALLDYPTIDKYLVFSFSFYQNTFFVLLIPRIWGFEQIEIQGETICEDFEINAPRKTYASSVTGGYYAARIEIAKYLSRKKRQAAVVVFRDVAPEYRSKGVWVIRETVKEALTKEPFVFETLDDAKNFINQRIRNGIDYWLKHSKLYSEIKCQKLLFDFL